MAIGYGIAGTHIMSDIRNCAIAGDTKVETPEGSMTIKSCAGKAIPVLTRTPDSAILFRMMRDVRKVAEEHPVLRITLETGASFRVAPEQLLVQADGQTIPAAAAQPGTALLPAFHYPTGYAYTADNGEARVSDRALKIRSVEPAGAAEVYTLGVNQTGAFFLAAGVLLQAEPG